MSTQASPAVPAQLRRSLLRLNELPSIPVIAQSLLALDLSTDEGEQQMMRLISQEPVISARLIGMANSPLTGASRQIGTVDEAATLLGLKRVKSVATGFAMSTRMEQPDHSLDINELWTHNWEVAYAMLAIAHAMPEHRRPQEDLLFLIGMLHDVGYLVLAHLDAELSDRLHAYLATPEASERHILEIETQLLGITHNELGAELAAHWQLPTDVVNAIRLHHIERSSDCDVRDSAIEEELLPSLIASIGERLTRQDKTMSERLNLIHDAEWKSLNIEAITARDVAQNAMELAEQAEETIAAFY